MAHSVREYWSGRLDSNQRPLEPHSSLAVLDIDPLSVQERAT